jgi:site-specific DNA recombinase
MKATTKLNYRLYARKSSVDEDKQVLSIESQVTELKKLIADRHITIREEDIMHESHSAKTAYARPVFEQLVKDIEQGRVQGIIGWHANRLSRNAVDAARLTELVDQGKLIEIITPSQTYRNSPQDKFFFTMLCSQAKMENDSKGIDVQRGLRKKNEMGYPAGVAKPGYINDYGKKGDRKIKADPDRFQQVKELLEMFITGKHSVRSLLKHSDEVMGLKSIQRKKEGGVKLQLSRLYAMLKDPFYAGFFYGKNADRETVRYEVNEAVPRMIREAQYWQIQAMLGRRGLPCPSVNTKVFPYKSHTKCGTCGGSVTAEHKYQLICPGCKFKFAYKNKEACPKCEIKITKMEHATYLHYIFYHCTKRKVETCPEGSVSESDIDNSMIDELGKQLETSKALSEWCIQNLETLAAEDRKSEYERKGAWERELAQKERESEELVRMRMKGLIENDEEFFKHKEAIEVDKRRIKQVLADMGGVEMAGYEEAKKAFSLIVGITETFRTGTFEEKQEALSTLGSNLVLKTKKLNITNKELFAVISRGLLTAKSQNEAFEPRNCEADKDETDTFMSVRPALLRG